MTLSWNSGVLAGPKEDAAWDTYLRALRDDLAGSWDRARSAYLTLERVRGELGLPLLSRPGEAASPGALSPGDQQNFFDAGALAHLLTTWMDEALAGKRKVGWDDAQKTLLIEQLPTDLSKVVLEAGRPRILSTSSGQPVPVTGDSIPGTLGALPVIAWVAITAVVAVSAYFVVEQICTTQERIAEQKTMETIATTAAQNIAAGSTPEAETKRVKAIYGGAAELAKEHGAAAAAENETGIQKTVRTLAWVALGVGTIYLASKVINTASPARTTA